MGAKCVIKRFKAFLGLLILVVWIFAPCNCVLALKVASSHDAGNCDCCNTRDANHSKNPAHHDSSCCSSFVEAKTAVPPDTSFIQHLVSSVVLWALSENLALSESRFESNHDSIYDHSPPSLSVILFSLRHFHQENAPPFVV